MARLLGVVGAVLVVAGGAASARSVTPTTVLTTKARITRFAQDGRWIAWTTEQRGCDLRLHIRSLASGKTAAANVPPPFNCIDGETDGLALAGDRALWGTLFASTVGEFRVTIRTMSASVPRPQRVQT